MRLVCATACLVAACGGRQRPPQHAPRAPNAEYDHACRRYAVRVSGPYHQELAGPLEHPLLDRMPKEARRTARAAGLEPLVLAMLELEGDTERYVELLTLRQEIFIRLTSLNAQLDAVLSEIDCTDDVIEQLIAALAERERSRELKLTLASIVVSAAAAVVAGAWEAAVDDSPGPPLIGVAGGVVGAGLGLSALFPRGHTLTYRHPHNLLRPIVRGEDPERLFPTFVRRLLAAPGAEGEASPREQLLAQFDSMLASAYPEAAREQARDVLFGDGGVYDQTLIAVREEMFDALESTLSTFARELELLTRYLVNLAEASVRRSP